MSLRYRYRKQILIVFLVVVVISVFSFGIYSFLSNQKDTKVTEVLVKSKAHTKSIKKTNVTKVSNTTEKEIMVDVKGEVVSPGIYKLKDSNRVIDAINMAGGLTEQGDTSVLNLSKKLIDEMVIIVYSYEQVSRFSEIKEEVKIIEEKCVEGENEVKNDACITSSKKEEKSASFPISINSAGVEELMMLDGVGEAKAKAIIAYREEHGPFQKIEDLLNVSGIGEGLLAKIKENITV